MGDAAATAHFSIGSGTKLALESAIALANYLHTEPTLAAFDKYEEERRLEVLRLQSAARNSLEWFEDVERYLRPRSGAVQLFAADPLAAHQPRKPAHARSRMAGAAERWFQTQAGVSPSPVRRPMFAPFKLRDMELKNRIVVSPMAQYKAVDGCPTDWHLVHYGERAKGGAGLVYTEMTCVSRKAGSRRAVRGSMRRRMRRPGSGSSISSMPRRRRRSAARSVMPAPRDRPSLAGRAWMHRCPMATGR
jgi:anthraniloyl-CoA monooxygenase